MKILIPFCFFLICNYSFSQISLSGTVVDNTTPLSFAEITLYKDSIPVKTTLTDENGDFIMNINQGQYYLECRFFGNILFKKEILLEQGLDLGIIQVENIVQLSEVIVTSKKRLIERRVDRLIFNVQNSVAVTGGNALDALKITPRIRVQNDQIFMIGKANMTVALNDRIVRLSGEDLTDFLKTFNAEDVKRIEVIPNPPAKYSAEGNSGVINIVTKSTKSDSWNIRLRSIYQQATYPTGNYGAGINFSKGKFEITSNFGYRNGSNAPIESNRINFPDILWDSETNRRDFRDNYSGRLGLNYSINEKLKTGFNLNYINSNLLIKADDRTNLLTRNTNTLDSIFFTESRDTYKIERESLNYYLIYDIDTLGKKISLDFDLFSYENKRNRIFSTQTFQSDFSPIENTLVEARNSGIQKVENYSINLDVNYPTKWVQFNYGGRISNTQTNNNFNFFNIIEQVESLDPDFSNKFQYDESIQALYFSGQKQINDYWEAKIGLRYEWTQTKGFSETINQTNNFDYSKLFPTFYISYVPNNNHSFSIDYGKRLQRPNFRLLNPFRIIINPFSFNQGNPFLQPAFTDNIEISYVYEDHLISNIYFSYTDDDFEQIALINAETNTREVIPLNFIINRTVGFNQTFITNPLKWWQVYASANVYYTNTESKIPEALQFLSGWNGTFSLSNDFNLNSNKTFLANINYSYTTEGVYHLDRNNSYQQLNASLKYIFMDGDLTLSLYANDIFRTSIARFRSVTNGIVNSNQNYYDEQYFRLAVLYNIGKTLKINARKNKNREELNRSN